MNQHLHDLMVKTGILDCLCDPWDQLGTGDAHGSVPLDLERFALLVVQECRDQCFTDTDAENIAKHFGVEL